MSRNTTISSRRAFLGGGVVALSAALASPLMAGQKAGAEDPWLGRKLAGWEHSNLVEFGELLKRKLHGSGLEPKMMDNHLRLRIPAAELFVGSKDLLAPKGVAILTLVADAMRLTKKVRVEVVAHHDLMAPDYDSWIFTRRRAEAARSTLMSRDIEGSRIRPTGLGGKFPYMSDGRNPANQRLELLFRPL